MKRIISLRVKLEDSTKREQFIRGSDGTVKNKMVKILWDKPSENYDFLIEEDGSKYIQNISELLGEVINVMDDMCIAEFAENEDGVPQAYLTEYEWEKDDTVNESLPQESTVKQLKELRRKSKGIDIGDRISNMGKQGANIQFIRNPIDTGIESIQDFDRGNKDFKPLNLKHLKNFNEYPLPLSTSDKPKRKKRRSK